MTQDPPDADSPLSHPLLSDRFEAFCRRKVKAAVSAEIPGYRAVSEDASVASLIAIGSPWTRALFDGGFYRTAAHEDLPSVNLVFVQSRDGNTGARNPQVLGGGETDLHLIYEGLSRVDADAVLSGATTARDANIIFSVWHPELIALRRALGRERHPAQILVTNGGDLPIETGLMFQEPALRLCLITSTTTAPLVRARIGGRTWIDVIDAGEPMSLTMALRHLRTTGIAVISAIGGRRTATELLRENLIADIYLTTSAIDGGEPNTPYYEGPPLSLRTMVAKAGIGPETGVRFEHLIVER